MFSILGFIFFFVLILVVLVLTILGGVLRTLFGMGRGRSSSTRSSSTRSSSSKHDSSYTSDHHTGSSKRKKVFDEDEGEYVDFEEISKGKP